MRNPQIFGVGILGRSQAVTAQRWINVYGDIQQETDRAGDSPDRPKLTLWGCPEKQSYGYLGSNPCRGVRVVFPYAYAVVGQRLKRIDLGGAVTDLGALLTTNGIVYLDDNGNQLLIVDSLATYNYQIFGTSAATGQAQGTLAQITAAGFLGASTCCTLNNFGIVSVPGTNPLAAQVWQISNVGDFTGWSGIQFNLKSLASDPLVRVIAFKAGGWLALMGTLTTELWSDTGAAPFPFTYLAGAALPYGLAAVASAVVFGERGILCLAQSEGGQVKPAILTGQGFAIDDTVAPPDFVATINNKFAYPTVSDAVGTQYEVDGHRIYRLSFPTAGKTWEWDSKTGRWSERFSYGYAYDRGLFAVKFGSDTLMTDILDGNLYKLGQTGNLLDPSVMANNLYQDQRIVNGTTVTNYPLIRKVVSAHLFDSDATMVASELQFDFQQGVGRTLPPGDDPTIMLEISRDKGATFGTALKAKLGKAGGYLARTRFLRLGIARDNVVALTMADAAPFCLTGEKVVLRKGA